MSRSRKKRPIAGVTGAKSEKFDKKCANRSLRQAVNRCLQRGEEDIFPVMRELSDVWSFCKDGKHYFSEKLIEEFPKIMRK